MRFRWVRESVDRVGAVDADEDVGERGDGAAAAELRWWRNDEAAALLRIEEQGLRWIEPSQRIRFAPMSADELARLAPPR